MLLDEFFVPALFLRFQFSTELQGQNQFPAQFEQDKPQFFIRAAENELLGAPSPAGLLGHGGKRDFIPPNPPVSGVRDFLCPGCSFSHRSATVA